MLISQLNEKDIDFPALANAQIVNHFEGITQLTTKLGFTDLLRDAPWVCRDALTLAPRGFNLGDPIQREEFIDEFRMNSAVNVLKIYCMLHSPSQTIINSSAKIHSDDVEGRSFTPLIAIDSKMLSNAIVAVQWLVRTRIRGECPGVDSKQYFKGRVDCFEESEWKELVSYSYTLLSQCEEMNVDCSLHTVLSALFMQHSRDTIAHFTSRHNCSEAESSVLSHYTAHHIRILTLLRLVYKHTEQFVMDGVRNIWVVKAPETSCGIGEFEWSLCF
jgi:hypothetical protein